MFFCVRIRFFKVELEKLAKSRNTENVTQWEGDESEDEVEEKFPKENFRVNREMRDEILVYDLFLTKF